MERNVSIPCVVSAKALWRAQYAPVLIRVGPDKQRLVFAQRNDLRLNEQSSALEELTATLSAKILREDPEEIVVSLLTRGIPTELSIAKAVFRAAAASA